MHTVFQTDLSPSEIIGINRNKWDNRANRCRFNLKNKIHDANGHEFFSFLFNNTKNTDREKGGEKKSENERIIETRKILELNNS